MSTVRSRLPKGSTQSVWRSKRQGLLIMAAVAVFGAIFILNLLKSRSSTAESTSALAQASAATGSERSETPPATVRSVEGAWVREDGGYTLELRNARVGGHIDATYVNPNPIRVSRAAWMERSDSVQVFVELNDTGYPGATYMLRHDRERDRLVGDYTQPAMQQTFTIEFVRKRD